MNDHQSLQALEGVLAQAVLPCSFAQAKSLLTIIGAGLVERDGFREKLEAGESPPAAEATGSEDTPAADPAPTPAIY